MSSLCRGCEEPVEWITTPNGKRMPVDPEPVSVVIEKGGPLRVVLEDGEVVAARLPRRDALFPESTVLGRTSHFATCPRAEVFRRAARIKKAREERAS